VPDRLALLLVVVTLVGAASGCATVRRGSWQGSWWVQSIQIEDPDGRGRTVEVRYETGDLGSGWSTASAPPGDFAFYNRDLTATVYADTSCGKKYQDAPLTVLSNHLTMGFEEVKVVEQTTLELSGRAGLERLSAGAIDGVSIRVGTSVIKKGPCVFDLVVISGPNRFDDALTDYRRFRDGFDAVIGR